MHAALLITAKDLRLGLRDRSVILMALVVPFSLAALFSFVFGGAASNGIDLAELNYLVVNKDNGHLGRTFVEDVLGGVTSSGITVEEATDRESAEGRVAEGGADALFVVPAGFTETVESGNGIALEVVANVDAGLGGQVAAAIAEGFTQELAGTQLAVASVLAAGGADAPPAEQVATEVQGLPNPVSVIEGAVSDNQLDQTTYLAAGMAVFFLFFTVQFGVLGMLEERRTGTLARLYAAPIARGTVIGAKTLTSFVLGVVSMIVLMIGTQLLLGADWGDPAGVLVLVLAGVIAAVSTVLLVGAVARTPEQAGMWQSIIAIVLGMAGGVFFDVSRGSDLLAGVSLFTPHQWFMRGLGELAGGGGVPEVLPAAGAMLLFGAFVLAVALTVGRLPGRLEL